MATAETPDTPDTDALEAGVLGPDRRSLLKGISTMGMAALVAPIAVRPQDPITDLIKSLTGGGNEPAPPSSPPPSAPPPAPTVKDYKPKGYVKASNTPLGSASDVPVESGTLYEADEYVVTQPKAGQFHGFDSLCTHEGCPVDVFDRPNIMSCSCHSTDFDATTGKVKSGPAKKPLPKKPIIIEGGMIYKAKKAK